MMLADIITCYLCSIFLCFLVAILAANAIVLLKIKHFCNLSTPGKQAALKEHASVHRPPGSMPYAVQGPLVLILLLMVIAAKQERRPCAERKLKVIYRHTRIDVPKEKETTQKETTSSKCLGGKDKLFQEFPNDFPHIPSWTFMCGYVPRVEYHEDPQPSGQHAPSEDNTSVHNYQSNEDLTVNEENESLLSASASDNDASLGPGEISKDEGELELGGKKLTAETLVTPYSPSIEDVSTEDNKMAVQGNEMESVHNCQSHDDDFVAKIDETQTSSPSVENVSTEDNKMAVQGNDMESVNNCQSHDDDFVIEDVSTVDNKMAVDDNNASLLTGDIANDEGELELGGKKLTAKSCETLVTPPSPSIEDVSTVDNKTAVYDNNASLLPGEIAKDEGELELGGKKLTAKSYETLVPPSSPSIDDVSTVDNKMAVDDDNASLLPGEIAKDVDQELGGKKLTAKSYETLVPLSSPSIDDVSTVDNKMAVDNNKLGTDSICQSDNEKENGSSEVSILVYCHQRELSGSDHFNEKAEPFLASLPSEDEACATEEECWTKECQSKSGKQANISSEKATESEHSVDSQAAKEDKNDGPSLPNSVSNVPDETAESDDDSTNVGCADIIKVKAKRWYKNLKSFAARCVRPLKICRRKRSSKVAPIVVEIPADVPQSKDNLIVQKANYKLEVGDNQKEETSKSAHLGEEIEDTVEPLDQSKENMVEDEKEDEEEEIKVGEEREDEEEESIEDDEEETMEEEKKDQDEDEDDEEEGDGDENLFLQDSYPEWGGANRIPPYGRVRFINTCQVDAWMVIFHALWKENEDVRSALQNDPGSEMMVSIENNYEQGKFDDIKSLLFHANSIRPNWRHIADFFQNQYLAFVRHMKVLYENKQMSICSSEHCPNRERLMCVEDGVGWVAPEIPLLEYVTDWILESGVSKCYEVISRTKDEGTKRESIVYCDGYRELDKRVFEGGASLPTVLPVDTESMAQMSKIKLEFEDIPKDLDVFGRKYTLRAVTFYNKKIKHYVCAVWYTNKWLFHDGLENNGVPELFLNPSSLRTIMLAIYFTIEFCFASFSWSVYNSINNLCLTIARHFVKIISN